MGQKSRKYQASAAFACGKCSKLHKYMWPSPTNTVLSISSGFFLIHFCGSWASKGVKQKKTKQVTLDDVGGDIMSKIPTSLSFLTLFARIKYDWNNNARKNSHTKQKKSRHIFTDHYIIFRFTRFLLWRTYVLLSAPRKTLLKTPNYCRRETLPGSKLCYPWDRQNVGRNSRRNQELWDASFFRMLARHNQDFLGLGSPGIPMNLYLALASWEGEQPEKYESDWKSLPIGSW